MITSKHIHVWTLIAVGIVTCLMCIFLFKHEVLGIVPVTHVSEYAEKLFDQNTVSTIDIQMDPKEWQNMLDNALQEEYVKCDVVINGETIYNVGIRPKGNTSLTQVANDPNTDRVSFKFEFDHYVKGQTYYGLDKLVVNNMYADATYMKEYLSYDLMDYMGIKTPLYAFTSITVNGEPWGLYLALEALEESFAIRNYGADYGKLYKPETMNMGGGGKMPNEGDRPEMPQGDKGGQIPMQNGAEGEGGKIPMPSEAEGESGQMPIPGGEGGEASQMPTPGNEGSQMPTPSGVGGEKSQISMPSEEDRQMVGNKPPEMPSREFPHEDFKDKGQGMPMDRDSGGSNLVYTDDNLESYKTVFESAVFKTSDEDKGRVVTALKKLSLGEELETYINVPEVLKYFAANTILVNLDSYLSNMQHNYYLYEEKGQLSMLPWDYNLSFGTFQGGSSTAVINFPIDTPVSGVSLEERPIIGKLLEVSEYKDAYHNDLESAIASYFESGLYEKRIDQLDALIGDYVREDATAFYSYDEYKASLTVLKAFGRLRAQSIRGQLEGTIPSTTETQKNEQEKLIQADSINLSLLGSQNNRENFKR
ncbi:CotH kinase family protein [Zhenhengia yiwuensis]|uniref:CotH kinase family protein n=1 Tax=Zhenhengia yiwuensis TaxID=2763666 RepID=A0A926I841_9FIRM|nr:CotH kinase family protein [Zhenhengia yiwuensis]MBC8578240.1 CotH kinase family protein [Zhenhengia yiwuensis]